MQLGGTGIGQVGGYESEDVTSFVPKSHVVLTLRIPDFSQQGFGVVFILLRSQIDHSAPASRIFEGHNLSQSPERSLGDLKR